MKNLQIGDLIQIYISISDTGRMMGPSVHGKKEYLTWVIYGGTLYSTKMIHAYTMDGTAVGIPINPDEIQDVQQGKGLHIIKEKSRKFAREYGGHHAQSFVNEFDESPYTPGERIRVSHDYVKRNKMQHIRSDHNLYKQDDLIFVQRNRDTALIQSPGLNKSGTISLYAIALKK